MIELTVYHYIKYKCPVCLSSAGNSLHPKLLSRNPLWEQHKGGIAGPVFSRHLPNIMPLRTMQNILYSHEAK